MTTLNPALAQVLKRLHSARCDPDVRALVCNESAEPSAPGRCDGGARNLGRSLSGLTLGLGKVVHDYLG